MYFLRVKPTSIVLHALLHHVKSLRMCAVVLVHPYTPSWRGLYRYLQIKKIDKRFGPKILLSESVSTKECREKSQNFRMSDVLNCKKLTSMFKTRFF